ncbi:olfactory receptor 5G3-like [Tachyglossus aculeatus]|uniref:olfactory receptor 5G3-like n=1 Tax=Tachyglossus aculeatus TaxID=9261 RepID=UPI0018F6A62B|nr:olfactory receptor 5G3-like [Tachyglossus aculeatus]
MQDKNDTVSGFSLVGLTDSAELQIPLSILFLMIYGLTLVGNLGIITLIRMDSRLQTPMYFFLSHLSFVDTCYSSVVAPKLLEILFTEKKAISFLGCAAQMWFFGILVATECFLLAAMACDRYVAICSPLVYTMIMSPKTCIQLATAPYVIGLVNATIHTTATFGLTFCGSRKINHFFCDIAPLLSLSCSNIWVNEILTLLMTFLIGVLSGGVILISYTCIISAILRIPSVEGRHKVFSTCASHLTSVIIFYGTLFITYVQPRSQESTDKVVSVFYSLVIPMLNPLIYSLRNKEVNISLRRMIARKKLTTRY